MSTMDEEERRLRYVMMAQAQRSCGYAARIEIDNLLAGYRQDDKRLEPFGFKVYSQGDEDGILQEIFRRLEISIGSFLEIGVENGLECNSLYLLYKGWRGCWIEGNDSHRAFIANKFYSLLMSQRLRVSFGMIDVDNINGIIDGLDLTDADLDLVSIDIDGNDIYLMEALDITPKVLCVEYNAKFRPPLALRQVYDPKRVWSGTDYFGASLDALTLAAEAKGYTLVGTSITGANAFFVRNDLVKGRFSPTASATYLYNGPRHWLIFDHFQHIGHRADFGPYVGLE